LKLTGCLRPVHVAAGVISDEKGRVLIAQRPHGTHQGGLWEFPGGKVESGETPGQGLARELREELGILVSAVRPLIRIRHEYQDRCILLDVYRVRRYDGEPQGQEGQALAWVHPDRLKPTRMPAADRPIIMALRLPDQYLITGSNPFYHSCFMGRLSRALDRGHRLVQLRAHELVDAAYRDLAREVRQLCAKVGARVVLNRDPMIVAELEADGLHLTARQLLQLTARPAVSATLIGASCHNANELAHAEALALDYAILSPVHATASHPGAVPLGWRHFAELVESAALPVYAMGGLDAEDVDRAHAAGAQGVAGIRAYWRDED
jgi:8-oxo-dGTP diphosphatase